MLRWTNTGKTPSATERPVDDPYAALAPPICTALQAEAVIVIVLNGRFGKGISIACQDPRWARPSTLGAEMRAIANVMERGPLKMHDAPLALPLCNEFEAEAVVVIVLDGGHRNGISIAYREPRWTYPALASQLRVIASVIERDVEPVEG